MSSMTSNHIEIQPTYYPNINQNYQLHFMLTQNHSLSSLQLIPTEEDEIPQRSTQLFYKNLLRKVTTAPVFKPFIRLQNRSQATAQSIGTGKAITAKMRSKLINWMEKLSLETFQFSIDTLLMAIKILDEYLCLTNESPKVLQLIGCACLYLAAKTKEVVIVAGQCYVVASAGCFTEEELMGKEMEVFKTLNYNTTFSSLSRVYKIIKLNPQGQVLGDYKREEVEKRLLEIAKSLELREWREHRILCMFLALTHTKNQLPQVSDLIQSLKSQSAF